MPHLADRFAFFYPMRIVGSLFLILVTTLYARRFDAFGTFYALLVAVIAVYPHLVHSVARTRPRDRLRIELRVFLFDAFLAGATVQLIAFTPLPAFILITVALVNALAVNGFGQMLLSAAALVAGMLASIPFVGFNFHPRDDVTLDIACSVFLFVYFIFFAYSSHNRNALLLKSQAELQEQKASLEIQKLRSDKLLLSLLPAELAVALGRGEPVAPAQFDRVTLLAVDFRGFSEALEAHGAADALAFLTHCFKAFDAIAGRRGFEKLKTMGDVYVTVAGIPEASDHDAADAVESALEIREFLTDLQLARRAHGEFVLDARIAVHCGPVVGGVVETAKISYDLWGSTMRTLLCLLRETDPGRISASGEARSAAGERFAWGLAGELRCPPATAGAFYTAERQAA